MYTKPVVITIGAVLRRFGIAIGAGTITYLLGAWSEALKDALADSPETAAWIPAIWIAIEAIQKYIREKRRF